MSENNGRCCSWLLRLAGLTILSTMLSLVGAEAQPPSSGDCSSWIGPTRMVNGEVIGPRTCTIFQEFTIRNASGVPYQRVEIGIAGAIEGYTVKEGVQLSQFSEFPEFVLAQRGNLGPYFHGISTYSGESGNSGLTVLLPKSPADWNGKLFMVFHGGSRYVKLGEMLPRKADGYTPLLNYNQYEGLMIDKGYAVVHTRRSANTGSQSGDREVTLDDGTVLDGRGHEYHVGLLQDWTILAKNLIEARLGSRPVRTYWYGRSGGAAPGRLVNYVPGANKDNQGRKIFDGLLLDDSAGGWYWPTMYFSPSQTEKGALEVDDQDHLVFDEARKAEFVPQIDILHQAYTGGRWVARTWGGSYQHIKRENARLLVEKGLGAKSRTYEIVGVSHADAGAVFPNDLWPENLDLTGVMDALIDVLDDWVERGVEPGPTRSDAVYLGDVDGDGYVENAAIELPEIACPSGVYYEFPKGVTAPGRTGFAAYLSEPRPAINADTMELPPGFEESWLEPLDSRGRPLDMNGNLVRDTRESLSQAWQRRGREGKRYGVLGPGETLTHDAYVSCVSRVTAELSKQNLLSEAAALHYVQEAIKSGPGKGR